jgi:hypothetical protein
VADRAVQIGLAEETDRLISAIDINVEGYYSEGVQGEYSQRLDFCTLADVLDELAVEVFTLLVTVKSTGGIGSPVDLSIIRHIPGEISCL